MNTNNQELKPKTFRFDNKFRIYVFSSMLLVQYIILMGKNLELNYYLKIIICILPSALLIPALLNFASRMKKEDEMSTKMVMEAMSLTFCITLVSTLAGCLLQSMSILPNFSLLSVLVFLMVTYCISYLLVSLKY